jgi:hypothetical protein
VVTTGWRQCLQLRIQSLSDGLYQLWRNGLGTAKEQIFQRRSIQECGCKRFHREVARRPHTPQITHIGEYQQGSRAMHDTTQFCNVSSERSIFLTMLTMFDHATTVSQLLFPTLLAN